MRIQTHELRVFDRLAFFLMDSTDSFIGRAPREEITAEGMTPSRVQ